MTSAKPQEKRTPLTPSTPAAGTTPPSAPAIDAYLAELPPTTDPDARQNAVTQAVKTYVEDVQVYLAELHRATLSGRTVNEAHSDLTDRLVRRLHGVAEELHLARGGSLESGVTVIAVGGYARREMAIYSDVDLLILYREGPSPYVEFLAERLQYWLWDAGVKLGCATRTIEETVDLGREDVTVRTTVLMARYLCGDGEFFHVFSDRIHSELLPSAWDFVKEQQTLIRERQLAYGDTLFLLQPNVKEGAGGLRDYHAAYWVARGVQTSIRNVDDLLHFGLLTEPEMNEYRDALDFLWATRNELHVRSKRANEQMSFELQEEVSEGLGYGSMQAAVNRREGYAPVADAEGASFQADDPDLPVERFMRDYYRHARAIKSYSDIVIELCARRVDPTAPESVETQDVEEGFSLVNDQLAIPHAAHLREDPLRMLKAFAVGQAHDVGLSRMAQRLIREQLPLIDDSLRESPDATDIFLGILGSETRVTRTLMQMNDVGVLAALMPEWEHIVCRWQHVIYHTYTVDVHSIFLVEELRRLWQGKYQRAFPELTEMMQEVKDREALFLGCLLHDIGKGFGGDHSNKGVVRARPAIARLGIEGKRADRVLFVVQHHLLMSHLAQSRDLSDPKLILELAQICGDRINLRNLYLSTFADIRASSVDAWTDWKGQLLRELYERTAEMLETGTEGEAEAFALIEARVERRQRQARTVLLQMGTGETKVDGVLSALPRRYFVSHTPTEIARHIQTILRLSPERNVATSVREMSDKSTEHIVCTPDVPGLYGRVAGVMTACGLNILGSHVYTTKSGLALEIYHTETPEGSSEERDAVWREMNAMLATVLEDSSDVDIETLVRRRRRPIGATRIPSRKEPRVLISNTESEFYTLVDVIADDRIGLLYDVTRAIGEQGFDIYISKAATIKDQVRDAFYLKNSAGGKIKDEAQLNQLETRLLAAARGDGDTRNGSGA